MAQNDDQPNATVHEMHEAYIALPVVTRPQDALVNDYRMFYSWKLSDDADDEDHHDDNHKRLALNWNTFVRFLREWCRAPDHTVERKLNVCTCARWSEVDAHGRENAGFWTAPVNSFQFRHAAQLTHARNLKALRKLPFPTTAVEFAALFMCTLSLDQRCENVRFCNFLCEWVRRKAVLLLDWEKQRAHAIVVQTAPTGLRVLDALVAAYACSEWYLEFAPAARLFQSEDDDDGAGLRKLFE